MSYPSYFTDMPVSGTNPPLATRVVSGIVWDLMYRQWQDRRKGVPPPRLGPPSAQQVFFTDPQSLAVCTRSEDFGLRLSLATNDVQDIRSSGCALIFLSTPRDDVERPQPKSAYGITPTRGRTVGGAREWIVKTNPPLDLDTMEVFFVNPSSGRWGPISP